MSYSRKLLYPQDEDLNSQFSKNYEYIILWMLNQNEYCQWADFVQGNIKESTLSGYLNKLLDRKFIVKPKRNHYEITKKGKDRLNELITIKESGSSLIYPPKAILRKRNYDHWILWMLNNNDFCKWSDFTDDQSPVRINQSSLSKNLNSLMDDGYIINENKEYKITPRGKSEYLKVLKLYELDRQSILDEESKRIEEITEKTSMFFEKYDITDNKLKFRFLNNVLQLDYEKISGEKGLLSEENYNKIIFFLAYNHPDQYPEHNNVEEFSRLYEIDSRDLDYYLKEIVENESFGKKIFKIEDEFGRTYYFQSDDKLEKILRTIVEEHITMANYLRSFQNGEKDETISLRLADVIEEILNDICPNLFHESLKEAQRYFLPEYIQYLAYKLESEEKLTDQAGKIKNVAFRTVSSIIQGFDSVLSTNGKSELEENFFSMDYDIFETLPIYFMSKLFFIRTEEFKRNFFKKHKKLLERIEEYLSLEKSSKLEQEIKEQKSILSILDNLILKDIIACLNHKFDISINLTDEIIEKSLNS